MFYEKDSLNGVTYVYKVYQPIEYILFNSSYQFSGKFKEVFIIRHFD